MKKLKAALVQMRCVEKTESNLKKISERVKVAAQQGARLVCLQELHNGLYFCQTENTACFDRAEPIPGPSTKFLSNVARRNGIVLVASLFERRGRGLYHNTAVVFEKTGAIAGTYRKMHIPDDPSYYEKFYFTPGDLGFAPVATSVGKLGVLVCWDQWYPEAARLMALKGADLLVYPTAIGWEPSDTIKEQKHQLDAWVTVQRGHAVANGLHVLTVNRTGFEPHPDRALRKKGGGIRFWGSSFATGPQGEILAQALADIETNLMVELDLRRTEEIRRIWPFLRDRRIDAYKDILKRYCT